MGTTLGAKLAKLRREQDLTQEQLAQLLGVTRQSVSKWESDLAYPETGKLIRLARMYRCSLDDLLADGELGQERPETPAGFRLPCFERKSRRTVGGLPLWHINIGFGRVATGVFALGLVARGVAAVGLFSVGVVSVGVCAVGALALGSLALGLAALGGVAIGILAAGAVALGVFALGGCAVGSFAVGAAAMGHYGALGDSARAAVAVGITKARGTLFEALTPLAAGEAAQARRLLEQTVPGWLAVFRELFALFLD